MSFWDRVSNIADSVVDVATDIGGNIVDAVVETTDTVVDTTVDVAETIVETVGSVAGGSLDITGDAVESVFEVIGLDDWGNEIDNTLDAVGDDIESLTNIIGDISITAVERVANAIVQTPDRLEEFSDDFFDDFWNHDAGIGTGFVDWLTNNTINAAEIVGLPEVIETVADIVKVTTTRPLSDREISIAQSVFGNSIDYSLVRIDEWALTAAPEVNGGRPYVMFNTINTWGALDNDHTLIHELTHIWQYQVEYGADYAPLALEAQNSEGYDYGGISALESRMNEGQVITSFNLEQQGDIVADYYAIREDGNPSNDNDLPTYAYFVDQVSTLSQEELASSNTQIPASSLGTLTSGVDGGILGTLGNSNLNDIYSFTLDSASSLQVTLQGLTADADVEIRDSAGNVVGLGNNGGTASENLLLELAAGDYVVEVKSYDNAETGYDLVLIPTPTTGGSNSIVSFITPNADTTDSGNPVAGVTPGENTIDGQVEWLFSNDDDNGTVPVGYTRVKGLSGHDNITGGSVSEWYNGNKGNDTVNGAGGIDTIFGGLGSDNLNGDAEGDQMFGNLNNDVLTGGDGDDTIFGGREDDVISGGAGNDILSGDRGQDILTGGPGNDTFMLPGGIAAATTLSQADVIMDFETGIDSLMLPDGINQNQLAFSSVNLQVDGGSAEASTVIELDGAFLAIVKGITSESELSFVAFDLSVVPTN